MSLVNNHSQMQVKRKAKYKQNNATKQISIQQIYPNQLKKIGIQYRIPQYPNDLELMN